MSLNWKIDKVLNFKTLCYQPPEDPASPERCALNPVTEALIMATMSVDLGAITEKNAIEFAQRLRSVEVVAGAFLHRPEGWKGSPFITEAEVRAHIGLSTNVSTTTRAAFDKKIARILRDQVARALTDEMDRAKRAAAEAAEKAAQAIQ